MSVITEDTNGVEAGLTAQGVKKLIDEYLLPSMRATGDRTKEIGERLEALMEYLGLEFVRLPKESLVVKGRVKK